MATSESTYKTIAEVYRNREHTLIRKLQDHLDTPMDVNNPEHLFEWLNGVNSLLQMHLSTTGRSHDKPVEVPVINSLAQDARQELLALLGPTQEEREAFLSPLAGLPKPRKQRSDKGKPRGPRKVANV